ncbi:MAG: BamA/TamA family outer membrane protein [Saprospiraceae bacterium]|nr:BamA/TamA family outer membrane protein [Saprospiraceae bacterium]MDW8483323.1 BamA/TamA family outer membrane protein [Saprospiraceae bacterium]
MKLALLVGGTGCQLSKYLAAEQAPILRSNRIEIQSQAPLPKEVKSALKSELKRFVRQKPNKRSFFGLGPPVQLSLYYRYRQKSSPLARLILKRLAEPPALYDATLSERTNKNFQNYARQRGYLNATSRYEVSFRERLRGGGGSAPHRWKEAAVTYFVDLGELHRIESVSFSSSDSQAHALLQRSASSSLLKRGSALDREVFEAERSRISYVFKNQGYAFFPPTSVEFVGDSSGTRTHVTVAVKMPDDAAAHRVYRVGKVEVFLDFVPELIGTGRDTLIEGIYFTTSSTQFAVNPERLLAAIAFRPDSLYRQEDLDQTARNLNTLGIFQFVTIRTPADSIAPGRINVAIALSLNKRLSVSSGFEFNSSTNAGSEITGRLFGMSAYLSVNHRNLLRGAENLRTDLSYSTELDWSAPRSNLFFSQEFKFQNELLFPRYFDYLGIWERLNRWNAVSDRFYRRLRREGRVRMSLNYSFLDLRGFYTYDLFNAAWGYSVPIDNEHQLLLDHLGIDVLRPTLRPNFDSIFGRNEFLRRSFGDQLFTGFLLRSFTYLYTGRPNVFGERWFFRLNAEFSGIEEHLFNRLWSAAFGPTDWRIAGLEFSKYARLDVTGSYTRDFAEGITAVFRMGAGVALPFGSRRDVPFVKQFFVGGPSSLRAWRIREIGPGGYVQLDESCQCAARLSPPFYQAADFRFELNGELRFPILWSLKGAVFVDAGNIWTLKPDPQRPNAELRWNAFQHIAIGTGFGLRLDFQYFVFRFDWGVKVRRPYRTPTEGHWVDWSSARWRDISNFNVAVGYPF